MKPRTRTSVAHRCRIVCSQCHLEGDSAFGNRVPQCFAGNGLGGYTLDAYGGLHPFGIGGAAPQTTPILNTGYWSWKAAQDIALIPGQNGGYTGWAC